MRAYKKFPTSAFFFQKIMNGRAESEQIDKPFNIYMVSVS